MKYVLLLIAAVALTGCELLGGGVVANECALSDEAKCLAEFRVESAVNDKLERLGSASRVDYDIACPPTYESSCADPIFGGDETGDFEVETIRVTP